MCENVAKRVFNNFDIMQIAKMTAEQWSQVKAIYENGIAAGRATFQTSAPEWQE